MKSRKNEGGSAKSCRANPICSDSGKNAEKVGLLKAGKISKYFAPVSNFDSPYKGLLTEQKPVLNDSTSEDSDFKTPKIIKTRSKLSKPVVKKAKKTSNKSKIGQTTLTKLIESQFSCSDVNAEHLQMAIQLSKSEQLAESCTQDSTDLTSTQTKIANVRATLEQFGFRSNKDVADCNVESMRRPKNSKYRFIKPILFLRTDTDQQRIISEKISSITTASTQNLPATTYPIYFLSSPYLQTLQYFGTNILQRYNIESKDKSHFYVKELNLPQSDAKCGCLLKDWGGILGRERTPPRGEVRKSKIDNQNTPEIQNLLNNTPTYKNKKPTVESCISPDLFDSDSDDYQTEQLNETITHSLNQSLDLMNRLKNTQSIDDRNSTDKTSGDKGLGGIEHFESFSDDVEMLSVTLSQHYTETYAISDEDSDVSPKPQSSSSNVRRDITVEFIDDDRRRDEINYKISECIENITDDIDEISDKKPNSFENKTENCQDDTLFKFNVTDFVVNASNKNEEVLDLTQNCDESIDLDNRREKALTIIDYVENMLNPQNVKQNSSNLDKINKDSKKIHNNKIDNNKIQEQLITKEDVENLNTTMLNMNDEVLDLTQSSDDSIHSDERQDCFDNELQHSHEDTLQNLNITDYVENKLKERNVTQDSIDLNGIKKDANNISVGELTSKEDTLENLNITEYIKNMLTTQNTSINRQPIVLDLTQSSDESMHADEVNVDLDEQANNHSLFDDLITKPLHADEANSVTDYSPKKFKKSVSFDYYKTEIVKPTPKKSIRRSLTFSSPGDEKSKVEQSELSKLPRTTSLDSINDEELNYSSLFSTPSKLEHTENSERPIVHQRIAQLTEHGLLRTPKVSSTPEGVLIKTRNVTPMPEYDRMNTPTISKELEKVGVKNLKRHRGVQILKHIYETTHPIVDEDSLDDEKVVKKRKNDPQVTWRDQEEPLDIVGAFPDSEELFFERRQLSKISSCAIPLHIAWHNFLASNPDLHENILLYEPLQLEVLHTMLKEQGHKYHLQDLLTFLDKKCITIRIQQNNTQPKRRKNTKRPCLTK